MSFNTKHRVANIEDFPLSGGVFENFKIFIVLVFLNFKINFF